MMAGPTTRWTQFARRFGRDGNPLRRRSDIIEAWLVPAAVVAFLMLAPLVAGLAAMGVRADNAGVQRVQQSWHHGQAVLLKAAPGPASSDHGGNTWTEWAPARWTADGQQHTGEIPVPAGSTEGSRQTVWLDRAGHVMLPPMNPAEVSGTVDTAILLAVSVVAIVVAVSAGLIRWYLDQRRLATWEAAWIAVEPRWSHQS
jgi:hypothetical protein